MTDKISLYKEIFKREPELQNTYFVAQRIDETKKFLNKTIEGLPVDDGKAKSFFVSLVDRCDMAIEEQCLVFGIHVMSIVNEEMNK